MPHSNISQPFVIDEKTLLGASMLPGVGSIPVIASFPSNVRLMAFNPAVFTHAYQLLGDQPQRFGDDLTLYLSTAKTFFERADTTGGINLTGFGNADSRKRLSEDLGVAYASLFMVDVFGLNWATISQIPWNNKLVKKRPDFQGYSSSSERFLYEAKGTTGLGNIEASMSKAIGQVKYYPEHASAKIAVVTYLCADDRFFPSASFVVDPPVMPETVPADEGTSKLLHLEKVFQFIGLSKTAKEFISALAKQLSEKKSEDPSPWQGMRSGKLDSLIQRLKETFGHEKQQLGLETRRIGEQEYMGRNLDVKALGIRVFNGVAQPVLDNAFALEASSGGHRTELLVSDKELVSQFDDGTILQVEFIR